MISYKIEPLVHQKDQLFVDCFSMSIILHKHCININLISHFEHNLCNISVKRDVGGKNCERAKLVSETWETFSEREIDLKRGRVNNDGSRRAELTNQKKNCLCQPF